MTTFTIPPQDDDSSASGSSSGWRTFFTIILGIVFFLSFLGFVGGIVVRRHLLDPNLYTQALAENNIYERIYTDFLADPAIEEKIKEVTGINIDLVVGEAYAQVVSAAYLILPPAEMQRDAERFFTTLTSYIAGDTPELPEHIGWGAALTPDVLANRIVKASTTVAMGAIDKTAPIVLNKTEPLIEAELMAYLDQIGGGRLGPVPQRMLRMTVRGMTTGDSERLIDLMLGPATATASEETRLQMAGALADDDLPTAIGFAIEERLKLRVSDAIAAAEPRLAETQALIGISGAAAAIGETRDSVVNNLNTVRGYASLIQTAMIPLAIIMLISLLLIVWLHHDNLASALRAAGWTLFLSSAAVGMVMFVAGFFLRSALQTRLAAAQIGPASLDAMIDDVVGSLSQGIWSSIWQSALPFFIIGLILLVFGYSKGLMAFLRRLLAPIWAYKWWVLGGLLGLFVLVPLLWQFLTADARAANARCNGYAELCDRKANEIAYATSHNSMSIAEYGWIWPMHDGTITDQLNSGVRALLIDTHYLDTAQQQADMLASLPPELRAVGQQAIDVFKPEAREGYFLCHQICGFGWRPLEDSLTEVRTFLDENPREVLFIVIQDEITNMDTQQAFDDVGLVPYIYTHNTGQEWPTLRQMIDADKRLVVMAENEGPPPDWYTNVWNETEETPYTFITKEQFNCDPNRGDTGKPFFLLNHWIQRGSPNRVDAAIVNDYDFLLARARQCEAERGQMPNFVAVNWYSQGDLLDVVNTLNGVGQPSQ